MEKSRIQPAFGLAGVTCIAFATGAACRFATRVQGQARVKCLTILRMNIAPYFLNLRRSTWAVVQSEFRLFRRFPKLALAALAIALVPAAYALIYLSSVWDPNAKTSALPVGVVNLDAGIDYQGTTANVGAELSARLIQQRNFGFQIVADAQSARAAVTSGALAFAVVIPEEFSALAVPGATPGGGKVQVILSEGNNYSAAGFAKRFAAELGHQVNEALNEKRWTLVLSSVDGSGKSLGNLQAGVQQLRTAAQALRDGSAAYKDAAQQVAVGFKQVGVGVRTLDSKWPADADLQSLKQGTQQLASGQKELGKGLDQLHGGAVKLTEGAVQMREQSAGIPIVGAKISKGAGELAAGGTQLGEGLTKAGEANAQLTQGAVQLETGTRKLVEGVGALGDGVKMIASKLPDDANLDAFAAGGKAVSDGAAKLLGGIELLDASLPKTISKLDGSARGLADSVEPALEILAPVANNGSAFVPNMVSVALWIGAVMTAYLFNMRLLLVEHSTAPLLAKMLGKFSAPASVVLLQVVFVSLMVVLGLGLEVPDYLTFVLTMMTASLVFLAMVFALLRVFGEAGKLLAVLLMTLQLAAGGGVMPIELSGDFFQSIHDWLPFSWVVKAFRASLFGAFDGDWLSAWIVMLVSGAIALAIAMCVGRWKQVPESEYVPGLDI